MLKSASVYHVANRRCAGDVARPAVTHVSSRSLKPSSTTRHSVVACKAAKIHDYTRKTHAPAPAAAAAAAKGRGRGSLQVAASSSKEGHRTQQLVDLAKEWGQAFAMGVCAGPTPAVMEALAELTDTYATVTSVHPLGRVAHVGMEGMAAKLEVEHDALAKVAAAVTGKPSAHTPRVAVAAADENADVAFTLLELPRADGVTAYSLLKFDMMLDDTARRVAAVTERQHIGGAVVGKGDGTPTPLGTNFPMRRLKPWAHPASPKARDTAAEAMRAWCAARSNSGPTATTNADALLRPLTDVAHLRMYDAYGVLPVICDPKGALDIDDEDDASPVDRPHPADAEAKAKAATAPSAYQECIVGFNQILDIIGTTQMGFNVQCEVVDMAVCQDMAAGFLHWRTQLTNKATGEKGELQGLEVDLFDPETGKLNAIYLYRDPMEFEEKMLEVDPTIFARKA